MVPVDGEYPVYTLAHTSVEDLISIVARIFTPN
jgi:hypothetical protein